MPAAIPTIKLRPKLHTSVDAGTLKFGAIQPLVRLSRGQVTPQELFDGNTERSRQPRRTLAFVGYSNCRASSVLIVVLLPVISPQRVVGAR